MYNIPQIFVTEHIERNCIPFANMETIIGKFYYWFTIVSQVYIPFISLLLMNSFIIYTLVKRSVRFKTFISEGQGQIQGQNEGHTLKLKSAERQIITMLLLLTFGFIILLTPPNILVIYINMTDVLETPQRFAEYFLFYQVGQKLYYLNYGINFVFYVLSGQKFRTDLINLFRRKRSITDGFSDVTQSTSG